MLRKSRIRIRRSRARVGCAGAVSSAIGASRVMTGTDCSEASLRSESRRALLEKRGHPFVHVARAGEYAEVRGLDSFPPGTTPNPVLVHLSFDGMVGLGLLIGFLAAAFWLLAIRRRSLPTQRRLLVGLIAAGPASVIAMESGWFVTEFGRQPWIVYGIMRTSQAVTTAPALGLTFAVFIAIYAGLAIATARLLLMLAARTREAGKAIGLQSTLSDE